MEPLSYKTVSGRGESLYEDRRSEFIGVCAPVKTEAEAAEFVKSIKKEHPAARHNVWAYILRSGAERYSDDGEPQGSAGVPTLEVMRRVGISDAVVVTTRYFGGILLGTGGLLRAYSAAAKQAIDDAGVVRMIPMARLRITCGYSDHRRIAFELERLGANIINTDFGADVSITLLILSERADELEKRIVEMTAGRIVPARERTEFGAEPIA